MEFVVSLASAAGLEPSRSLELARGRSGKRFDRYRLILVPVPVWFAASETVQLAEFLQLVVLARFDRLEVALLEPYSVRSSEQHRSELESVDRTG